ncbi:MAG: hypothetical protein EZS28_014929 [Streblomastix strix]|uniref:Uncharacterized protein n=1 Tax=Streblomastix strix TaxID=222440 RepID=A0A5J4W4R4_9EUKA|nr:MAG: hypothetical protein EZS28_014929 [Streblomastix strix]
MDVYIKYKNPEESDKNRMFLALEDFSYDSFRRLKDQKVQTFGVIEKPKTDQRGTRIFFKNIDIKTCYQYLQPQHVKVCTPSTYQDLFCELDDSSLNYMNVLMYVPNDEYSKIVSVVRCLMSIKQLAIFMLSYDYMKQINTYEIRRAQFIAYFAKLFRQLVVDNNVHPMPVELLYSIQYAQRQPYSIDNPQILSQDVYGITQTILDMIQQNSTDDNDQRGFLSRTLKVLKYADSSAGSSSRFQVELTIKHDASQTEYNYKDNKLTDNLSPEDLKYLELTAVILRCGDIYSACVRTYQTIQEKYSWFEYYPSSDKLEEIIAIKDRHIDANYITFTNQQQPILLFYVPMMISDSYQPVCDSIIKGLEIELKEINHRGSDDEIEYVKQTIELEDLTKQVWNDDSNERSSINEQQKEKDHFTWPTYQEEFFNNNSLNDQIIQGSSNRKQLQSSQGRLKEDELHKKSNTQINTKSFDDANIMNLQSTIQSTQNVSNSDLMHIAEALDVTDEDSIDRTLTQSIQLSHGVESTATQGAVLIQSNQLPHQKNTSNPKCIYLHQRGFSLTLILVFEDLFLKKCIHAPPFKSDYKCKDVSDVYGITHLLRFVEFMLQLEPSTEKEQSAYFQSLSEYILRIAQPSQKCSQQGPINHIIYQEQFIACDIVNKVGMGWILDLLFNKQIQQAMMFKYDYVPVLSYPYGLLNIQESLYNEFNQFDVNTFTCLTKIPAYDYNTFKQKIGSCPIPRTQLLLESEWLAFMKQFQDGIVLNTAYETDLHTYHLDMVQQTTSASKSENDINSNFEQIKYQITQCKVYQTSHEDIFTMRTYTTAPIIFMEKMYSFERLWNLIVLRGFLLTSSQIGTLLENCTSKQVITEREFCRMLDPMFIWGRDVQILLIETIGLFSPSSIIPNPVFPSFLPYRILPDDWTLYLEQDNVCQIAPQQLQTEHVIKSIPSYRFFFYLHTQFETILTHSNVFKPFLPGSQSLSLLSRQITCLMRRYCIIEEEQHPHSCQALQKNSFADDKIKQLKKIQTQIDEQYSDPIHDPNHIAQLIQYYARQQHWRQSDPRSHIGQLPQQTQLHPVLDQLGPQDLNRDTLKFLKLNKANFSLHKECCTDSSVRRVYTRYVQCLANIPYVPKMILSFVSIVLQDLKRNSPYYDRYGKLSMQISKKN